MGNSGQHVVARTGNEHWLETKAMAANDVIGLGGCTWGHLADGLEVVPAHAAAAAFAWNPNQTLAELPEDCRQFMADTMSWRE